MPNATVFPRKARLNKAPAQADYYYLRIGQIDGEAAWSSPIWIGEENSQRKQ